MLVFEAILKNTMKMISLRSLASITVFALALAQLAPGEVVFAAAEQNASPSQDAAAKQDQTTDATPEADKSSTKQDKALKKGKKKSKEETETEKEDSKGDEKAAKPEKSEAPPLSAAEEKALAAVQERAKLLKSISTPFNSPCPENPPQEGASSTLSLRPGGSALQNSLARRLVPNRVYLPGKLIIGKPAEFVVKARPGSHVAIAMADKDSGAKALFGQPLRLGPDRKLMAAGVVPETGLITLIVDMPIEGDLIGLPVFFETVIWQKPDFSDLELASPVKSESASEIASKANAVIVAGENIKKRGLRFEPDSGVPLYQRGDRSLESGRL